jgi:hypothetical protein
MREAMVGRWLYMAKFKHKVRGIFYGWTLGEEAQQQPSGPYARAHTDSLGKLAHAMHVPTNPRVIVSDRPNVSYACVACLHHRVHGCRYGNGFASLSSIGNWLVHLPHEESLHPPRRISYSAVRVRTHRAQRRHETSRDLTSGARAPHQYVNHHSVVVIDRQPSKQDLRDYLRHLTRGNAR